MASGYLLYSHISQCLRVHAGLEVLEKAEGMICLSGNVLRLRWSYSELNLGFLPVV